MLEHDFIKLPHQELLLFNILITMKYYLLFDVVFPLFAFVLQS